MLKKIITYLFFLARSTDQHGIHSPFIYKFVTQCLYAKYKGNAYTLFKKNKAFLLKDHTLIQVTDFGAGSKVFTSDNRKISAIARVSGISDKRARLLLKITGYFQPKSILEIGTSLGLATTVLALTDQKSKVITLEGCKNTAAIAKNRFKEMRLKNIELITGNFNSTLISITKNATYDLIFFDGHHSKEATLHYFNTCLTTVHNDTVWIFDDIYWSEEMQVCWKQIKQHPMVTVTLDTYQWGIVFFRKEQVKEHFTVRV